MFTAVRPRLDAFNIERISLRGKDTAATPVQNIHHTVPSVFFVVRPPLLPPLKLNTGRLVQDTFEQRLL